MVLDTVQKVIDASDGKAYWIGDIPLDERFWDCNCEDSYINSKYTPDCIWCGAKADSADQPDARVNEIMVASNHKGAYSKMIARALGYEVS
jgi:hypothetical protein